MKYLTILSVYDEYTSNTPSEPRGCVLRTVVADLMEGPDETVEAILVAVFLVLMVPLCVCTSWPVLPIKVGSDDLSSTTPVGGPDKDDYLKSLERLRHIMILFRWGYGSREMAMVRVNSARRYPEAYEAFERELEDTYI
jgi:hypothetical protein